MIYTDAEKRIYASPLQTQHDPIEVSNKFTVYSQGKFNDWLAVWYDAEADAVSRAAAALQIAGAARQAFGWKPLTDGGVGDGDVLEAVDHFTEYLSKKG